MDITVTSLLRQILSQGPELLAYTAGLVISFVYLQQHPGPAKLALLGSAILVLTTIGLMVFPTILNAMLNGGGGNFNPNGAVLQLVFFLGHLLRAAGIGLLIAAAFNGRAKRPSMGPMANMPPVQNINPGTRFPS